VLPSGVLLSSAATAGASGPNGTRDVVDIIELVLCAAVASCLGDFAAYRLAWHGGDWLERRVTRSRRIAAAQQQLGRAVVDGGGALVLIARFAPAGRSVVSLGAGAAHRRPIEFLPWSALAGLAWAAYGVGLGYFGGQWFGRTWLATAASLVALFGAGFLATFFVRRGRRTAAAAQAADAGDGRDVQGIQDGLVGRVS
jgi:membrane protein DedA with SNARE-associated domain